MQVDNGTRSVESEEGERLEIRQKQRKGKMKRPLKMRTKRVEIVVTYVVLTRVLLGLSADAPQGWKYLATFHNTTSFIFFCSLRLKQSVENHKKKGQYSSHDPRCPGMGSRPTSWRAKPLCLQRESWRWGPKMITCFQTSITHAARRTTQSTRAEIIIFLSNTASIIWLNRLSERKWQIVCAITSNREKKAKQKQLLWSLSMHHNV